MPDYRLDYEPRRPFTITDRSRLLDPHAGGVFDGYRVRVMRWDETTCEEIAAADVADYKEMLAFAGTVIEADKQRLAGAVQ